MKILQKIKSVSIIIMVLSFMACGEGVEPTLFVTEEGKALQVFSLFAVPVRRIYPEGGAFARTKDHLSVFVVDNTNGNSQEIPLDEITITLEDATLISPASHTLRGVGEIPVTVTYGTLNTQYTIFVGSDVGSGGSDPEQGSTSSGSGIAIDLQWN